MAYVEVNAVYALNRYIDKALQVNLGWTPVTYFDPNLSLTVKSTPIIPSQQQPEFMQVGKSFLVYGSATLPQGRNMGVTMESIVYTVWSPSSREATKTANFLHDLFERSDHTADAVNSYLDSETSVTSRDRKVSFLSVTPGLIEKAEPVTSETGWAAASVTIETMYTNKNSTVETRFNYT